ncbi:HNH endonuclease signature motif containing protein [Enteractinococcus coprophilus]|uniref:HNH nuclease domain-containing protein n=1 Tax=Enteractinococcus coprophilus TaxID=1027633 RepID=A0A543A002_9MICC|nr:HNH endonuclease signature motif containing protein [Enteractinococcus coprophilus]TQL65915.1 hypothetical protein FB556_2390 [Enteractinococcus coprophilus]
MASTALPDLGIAVPMPAEINLEGLDDLSIGQLTYLTAVAQQKLSQRMADPGTAYEFAQYRRASGADWSGHQPQAGSGNSDADATDSPAPMDALRQAASGEDDPTDVDGNPIIAPRPLPAPPENQHDAIPFIAQMVRGIQHAHDAMVTGFARHLQPVFFKQPEYLGTPEGVQAFRDSTAYFKEVLRFSGQTTKKIHDRMPYVTWNPGQDPTMGVHQPKLLKLAQAFKDGTIPAENVDRIVWLDQDLTQYVRKTTASHDDKDAVLREFESTLVEASEASNPDAFNAARRRWADKIAHALDADGPPIAQTLRKKADNVLRDQGYADGSGKIWMHATPDIYAKYKHLVVNQLNRNGAPLKPDGAYTEWLYNPAHDREDEQETPTSDHSTTSEDKDTNFTSEDSAHSATQPGEPVDDSTRTDDHKRLFDDLESDLPMNMATLDDLSTDRDPAAAVAEDDQGNTTARKDLDAIEQLTPGQLVTAILVGVFHAIFSMAPDELQLKRSHGADATLVIVQDVETAYQTLGIGAIPEDVRRPRGPHGVVPTVLKRPNPDNPAALCRDPNHVFGSSPPPWTGYISEALNIGALHPKDAEKLACDSQLVGQIWNHHHSVLNQRRTYRTFTPAQRRAILARDRGCQAPGCTIIAAWCQIHHLRPWELGGLTDVENAISLCAFHHAAVHNGKWTIRTLNATHFFQPAPWLDPTQPLLRNMYWAI